MTCRQDANIFKWLENGYTMIDMYRTVLCDRVNESWGSLLKDIVFPDLTT